MSRDDLNTSPRDLLSAPTGNWPTVPANWSTLGLVVDGDNDVCARAGPAAGIGGEALKDV